MKDGEDEVVACCSSKWLLLLAMDLFPPASNEGDIEERE